jgi:hypothetical protein
MNEPSHEEGSPNRTVDMVSRAPANKEEDEEAVLRPLLLLSPDC